MAQYDGLVIKTGIPTVIGVDSLRADRISVAGWTTTGLATGDAVQVSSVTPLVLSKAVNTSTKPIVGIFDGITGSVVCEGVVAATFSGSCPAAGSAVYLSATAGALTGTKPTNDVLHEVGVVVEASTSRVLLQQKPVITLPASVYIYGVGFGSNVEKKLSATGAHVASHTLFSGGDSAWWAVFDGTRVWATRNADPGQLACVDVATGAITGPFTIGRYPGLTFDGTYLWMCGWGASVYKVNLAGSVVATYSAVTNYPKSICYDGVDSVWICNSDDNNIRRMRCSDGVITATVALGVINQFAACSTKTNLWVGCDAYVVKIRLSDNTVIGTYSNGGDWGGAPCYDGTRIWQAVGGDYMRRWTETTGASLGDVDTGNYHGASNQVPCFDGTHIWVNHQYSLGTDYGWHKFLASDGSYVGTYNGAQTSQKSQLCSTARILPW